jgi:hypothetical protein
MAPDGTAPSGPGPGQGLVGGRTIVVLVAAMVVLVVLTFYGIWAFWPSETAQGGRDVHFFGVSRTLSRESLFFVTVALAGALGGSVHSLRSLGWYIGNRNLRWSWTPFYLLRPLVGATIATVFYLVLRAGLFSPSTQTKTTSPYGFAALAALVGLFSEQAIEKLKTVAEEFFQQAPKGSDPAPADGSGSGDGGAAEGTEGGTAVPTPGGSLAVTGDASDVGAAGATVAGTATSVGSFATFRFEYGPDTSYGSATESQALAADTAGAAVSATLTDLQAATLYHYRLVVTDESGTSYGDDRTLTTSS